MNDEEYKKIKNEIENGDCNVTHDQCLLYLIRNKASREEVWKLMENLKEISKKLDTLHNYIHGHLEGHPIFRNAEVSEDQIVTTQNWEGNPIVFKKVGEI